MVNVDKCLYRFCNVKDMRSQFVMSVDMQFFFKLRILNFFTCLKVSGIHGIEAVFTTRNFFSVELTAIVIVLPSLKRIVFGSTGRGAVYQCPN